jgi:catechol 2,3-dioxygenase-like lactoylglutathione lyase family enzyme
MMKLDHYSIRTLELDKVKDFFHDLLGLEPGFRPSFNFPGYWLYGSDPEQAIVHLIGQKKDSPPLEIGEDTGAYDHVAFQADTYDEISERIKENDWTHWENRLPNSLARQIFIKGPHNLTVEIIFPAL